MTPKSLETHPIHLGLGATAESEPEFTGQMEWYAGYAERHKIDGAEGRLVSHHSFTKPWDMWEMHPSGSEVVLCLSGNITLHQEITVENIRSISLKPGEYAVNLPGVWHTADVNTSATVLFITAGDGTQHRPRKK